MLVYHTMSIVVLILVYLYKVGSMYEGADEPYFSKKIQQ